MARTSTAPVLVLLAVVIALASATPSLARGGRHPYFDDRGTLAWYESLAEAEAAARSQNKVILVEYGRLRCGSCRALVSGVLPDPRVRTRLQRVAVGLASDCDRPEPTVDRLLRSHLRGASMLPFVAFLTPDGRWITGFAGNTSAERFLAYLYKAEASRPAPCTAPPTPAVRPCPCPAPLPRPSESKEEPAPARKAAPEAPIRLAAPLLPPRTSYPAPDLSGDPDAQSVGGSPGAGLSGGCCAPPPRARRKGPLPPPRIVINPPVLVRPAPSRAVARSATTGASRTADRTSVSRPPTHATGGPVPSASDLVEPADLAARAAEKDEWSLVIALANEHPGDPGLSILRDRAHRWAHEQLSAAVDAVAAGRFEDSLQALQNVILEMHGQPESVDAERGLAAIRTLLELRALNPEGEVARYLRRNASEEMRGTRWARLFCL